MAKGPQKDPGEIIREYIGINRNRFEVETLSETRGGTLYKMLGDGRMVSHYLAGRQARTEAVIVFDVIEIQEVTPQLLTLERRQKIERKLEDKAAKLKVEKGK